MRGGREVAPAALQAVLPLVANTSRTRDGGIPVGGLREPPSRLTDVNASPVRGEYVGFQKPVLDVGGWFHKNQAWRDDRFPQRGRNP